MQMLLLPYRFQPRALESFHNLDRVANSNPSEHELQEAMYDFLHNGVLSRIDERGKRCDDLYQWGLHPHSGAPDSALAADDEAFTAKYPLILPLSVEAPVTEHALFPAVSATQSMHTAGLLITRRRSHQEPHFSEVLQLCRVAMESAALTIWLLKDPSSNVRRDRCMSEEMEQLEQRKRFLATSDWEEKRRPERFPQRILAENAAYRENYNDILTTVKKEYTYSAPPGFTQMVRESAQWIDDHTPAHDDGEITVNGLEAAARSFYSYGSSFIHGYKWITKYAGGGTIFNLLAEALTVTLNMVECAACLYEAASRSPGGARREECYVPARFERTITAWSAELFAT
ncbi:hypothetical protein [Mycobacteroides abscessus]|uniref:hypothetical protein n=1 Tax=Mycobacteroides abscessus TaxID=36809 RepID=UPI000940FDDB|nr:hypothetical protein [Mycobacteroides abscessus]